MDFCQAQVQSPKVKTKGTWADTKIPWATTPTIKLLSMKECSGKKVLIAKVAQNDPLDSSSQKIDQEEKESSRGPRMMPFIHPAKNFDLLVLYPSSVLTRT